MSRKVHSDGEQRPPAAALRAVDAWLDANGLRRVALVEALASSQVHISRLFAGGGYLSATQGVPARRFLSRRWRMARHATKAVECNNGGCFRVYMGAVTSCVASGS